MYFPSLTTQCTLIVPSWDEATQQNDNDPVTNKDNSIATLLFRSLNYTVDEGWDVPYAIWDAEAVDYEF